VKGLGAALQSKILQGIKIRRDGEGQRHLHRAATLIESAREQLGRLKLDIKRVIPAGDFRRGCELVSDLALVAETSRLRRAQEIGVQLTVKHFRDRLAAGWRYAAVRDRLKKAHRRIAETCRSGRNDARRERIARGQEARGS
jgi:DNA polymerase/3'-5' exonuclease PolX